MWKLALGLGLLLTLSCQPYLDHSPEVGFAAGPGDRGSRRRLALTSLEGSSDSVLLVFNQPLRVLESSAEPPFRPVIRPEVPVEEVRFEGAAGVRVTFGQKVFPSRPYTVEIPAGWRAATGAVMSHPVSRRWMPEEKVSERRDVRSVVTKGAFPDLDPRPVKVEPAAFPSGRLWIPRCWVGSGEPVIVVGVGGTEAASRGRLRLLDQNEREVWGAGLSWRAGSPFVARVPAPEAPARYRLEFVPPRGASWEGEIQVCPLATPGESTKIELEGPRDGLPEKARLVRTGARHRLVALRAYLKAPEPAPDFPAFWSRPSDTEPRWRPLAESTEEELWLEIPSDWTRGGSLVVEAVDRDRPRLILARTQRPLKPTAPRLTLRRAESGTEGSLLASITSLEEGEKPLSVEASLRLRPRHGVDWVEVGRHEEFALTPWALPLHRPGRYRLTVTAQLAGQRTLKEVYERDVVPRTPAFESLETIGAAPALELGRWDGLKAQIRAADRTRLTGSPGAAVGWYPSPPGWEEILAVGDGPDGVPLLTPLPIDSKEIGGWLLDSRGDLALSAPSVGGTYRYWSVGPRSGTVEVEIEKSSRWTSAAPAGVRVGDRFRAGPRFSPGPLVGDVGLTASAEGEGLAPSGFRSTAGVAKGSELTLLFDYQAPEEDDSPLSLVWKVGRGGYRQVLTATVEVWPTLPIPHRLETRRLTMGKASGFTAHGPWRLEARVDGGQDWAEVIATDPGGIRESRRLTSSGPPLVLEGEKAGVVRLTHRSGSSPVTAQWTALEPDLGQAPSWASRAYLDRLPVDGEGKAVTHWSAPKGMGVVLSLINPAAGLSGRLEFPLPAGVEPVALRPLSPSARELPWTYQRGTLGFSVENLPAGEYLWKVDLEARAGGDYLWPSARLLSLQGDLWALSSSSRFSVDL